MSSSFFQIATPPSFSPILTITVEQIFEILILKFLANLLNFTFGLSLRSSSVKLSRPTGINSYISSIPQSTIAAHRLPCKCLYYYCQARYALVAEVGQSVVHPMVISLKLSKIDP